MTTRDVPDSGSRASIAARLGARIGREIDPEVSLDGPAAEPPSSHSSELLERLHGHGPKDTRYEMRGEIARGGMGAILKVWDGDLRRTLAMKVMLGEQADGQQLARFLEEAQVTGQLDHPGIVPVHELGLDANGRVFFTMRLVRGRDLREIIALVHAREEGWTLTKALGVILRVCEAVAYAHAKGVIHRDIKPANVMVGRFGETYVMDWGLAKVVGRSDSHDIRLRPETESLLSSVKTERTTDAEEEDSPLMTMDGAVVGTPAYMPPEQANGRVEEIDVKSDVYAVGALLYHLLTGRAPYVPAGMRVPAHTVWRWVIEGPPKPVHTLAPEVPAELVAICDKAMSRDRSLRYPDTLAMAEDLQAFLDGRVVQAYRTGAVVELKKWVQRNRALAIASAAAIVLALTGLGWNAWIESRNSEAMGVKNLELSTKNAELVAARATALENERLATQKANDVLSLSAIQELEELVTRADALWPALPENVPAFERWLEDARVLVAGRPADPERGVGAHPGLAEHEAKLAELETRARPLDEGPAPEQLDHPRRPELESMRAHLAWRRRMLGQEPWPTDAEIEAQLAQETLPADARGMNLRAWPLVDPDAPTAAHGSESRALGLARRALTLAEGAVQPEWRKTLAWALARCGRFEDALDQSSQLAAGLPEWRQAEFADFKTRLERFVGEWRGDVARAKRSEETRALEGDVERLAALVRVPRTFEFEDPADRWWHVQLSQLVADLRAFSDPATGLDSSGISPAHGWGVRRRLEFARTVAERSLTGSDAARRWQEAIAAIAQSERYGRLAITPQIGLLPLGPDPRSGLWEFAHLQTGTPPERDGDGQLQMRPESGLVFVLIPAGSFWMGAQSADANGRNYDPEAIGNEGPLQEVHLDAYFLAKDEMTQGQWRHVTGQTPSLYAPGNYAKNWNRGRRECSLLHPVEEVSWRACDTVLRRLGLSLPSEARWEYACRAGTSTPWSSGASRESLASAANVADAHAQQFGGTAWDLHEGWNDGNTVHAEIGSYAPNGFGLRDMHGNVAEWCSEGYAAYGSAVDPATGLRSARFDPERRVARGGNFRFGAVAARSSRRWDGQAGYADNALGLRPARDLRR